MEDCARPQNFFELSTKNNSKNCLTCKHLTNSIQKDGGLLRIFFNRSLICAFCRSIDTDNPTTCCEKWERRHEFSGNPCHSKDLAIRKVVYSFSEETRVISRLSPSGHPLMFTLPLVDENGVTFDEHEQQFLYRELMADADSEMLPEGNEDTFVPNSILLREGEDITHTISSSPEPVDVEEPYEPERGF